MKVLVTGAAGFIGSALALKLLARGDRVHGIDNLNNDKYFLFHPFPQRTLVMEIHYAQ